MKVYSLLTHTKLIIVLTTTVTLTTLSSCVWQWCRVFEIMLLSLKVTIINPLSHFSYMWGVLSCSITAGNYQFTSPPFSAMSSYKKCRSGAIRMLGVHVDGKTKWSVSATLPASSASLLPVHSIIAKRLSCCAPATQPHGISEQNAQEIFDDSYSLHFSLNQRLLTFPDIQVTKGQRTSIKLPATKPGRKWLRITCRGHDYFPLHNIRHHQTYNPTHAFSCLQCSFTMIADANWVSNPDTRRETNYSIGTVTLCCHFAIPTCTSLRIASENQIF